MFVPVMINDFIGCHSDQPVKFGEYRTKTAKDYYELFNILIFFIF